jgi:MHS family proline/betaine transporter-like MFS transporter
MGQGVVWYTGQFYAMTFIEKTCGVEFIQTRNIIAIALLIGTPLFIYFGWWSDKVGRKMIMMTGLLLAVFLYRPIYKKMYALADISGQQEIIDQKTITRSTSIRSDGSETRLAKVQHVYTEGNSVLETTTEKFSNGKQVSTESKKEVLLDNENYWMMILLVFIQVVLVTMVYGPIAAFLVELFPTRIRYTSMSLPYHIGNGVFGGLVPLIATSLYEVSKTEANPAGDPFAGLWYPILVAGACFIIGMTLLKSKKSEERMH